MVALGDREAPITEHGETAPLPRRVRAGGPNVSSIAVLDNGGRVLETVTPFPTRLTEDRYATAHRIARDQVVPARSPALRSHADM